MYNIFQLVNVAQGSLRLTPEKWVRVMHVSKMHKWEDDALSNFSSVNETILNPTFHLHFGNHLRWSAIDKIVSSTGEKSDKVSSSHCILHQCNDVLERCINAFGCCLATKHLNLNNMAVSSQELRPATVVASTFQTEHLLFGFMQFHLGNATLTYCTVPCMLCVFTKSA